MRWRRDQKEAGSAATEGAAEMQAVAEAFALDIPGSCSSKSSCLTELEGRGLKGCSLPLVAAAPAVEVALHTKELKLNIDLE